MLRFTPEQEQAVNQAREAFNLTQAALAAELVGNSIAVPVDAWRRIDSRGAMIQRDVLNVFNRLAAADTTPLVLVIWSATTVKSAIPTK